MPRITYFNLIKDAIDIQPKLIFNTNTEIRENTFITVRGIAKNRKRQIIYLCRNTVPNNKLRNDKSHNCTNNYNKNNFLF